jgi:hypothetical protein
MVAEQEIRLGPIRHALAPVVRRLDVRASAKRSLPRPLAPWQEAAFDRAEVLVRRLMWIGVHVVLAVEIVFFLAGRF